MIRSSTNKLCCVLILGQYRNFEYFHKLLLYWSLRHPLSLLSEAQFAITLSGHCRLISNCQNSRYSHILLSVIITAKLMNHHASVSISDEFHVKKLVELQEMDTKTERERKRPSKNHRHHPLVSNKRGKQTREVDKFLLVQAKTDWRKRPRWLTAFP